MNNDIQEKMNQLYQSKTPFFFLLDYAAQDGEVVVLDKVSSDTICYATPTHSNHTVPVPRTEKFELQKFPISYTDYNQKWDYVHQEIVNGNSYLLNLSCVTPIQSNYSIKEMYDFGISKYKLWYRDKFVHFSPETFITIQQEKIETFPMKGTIDADREDARKILENDAKERAEQYIITDLLRNDLSLVAENVSVEKFRYFEKVQTHQSVLWQVSSHISGELKREYQQNPGDIFEKILPAGSICGAPKKKTLEIIAQAENYQRGFYTGVWGIFDGRRLESCIMIRFVEKTDSGLVFKSGGGITALSDPKAEYEEMIQKIYVPVY